MLGYFYSAQSWMIFPGRASQGQPWARVAPRQGTELLTLTTAGGERVAALFGPALSAGGQPLEDAASRPTILFFYGNGDCLANARGLLEDFRRLGVNVLVPEYVGYGMSEGEAGEAGCYATADAAYEHLVGRPDVDSGRIYAAGWSLGAAVAVDLASRRPVAGLAAFSAFTSVADMARAFYPFLPVGWILQHRFENEAKIARVSCPVLIGHGRLDRVIPFAMSERLAAAAAGPVTRFEVETDHNDFFAAGSETVLGALGRFVGGP